MSNHSASDVVRRPPSALYGPHPLVGSIWRSLGQVRGALGPTLGKAWLFQYASQNPLFVAVSPLLNADIAFPADAAASENWEHLSETFARHRYWVDIRQSAFVDAVLPHDLASVRILEGLHFDGALYVQSRFDPVPLERFLDDLPDVAAGSSGDAARQRPDGNSQDSLIQELPWLSKIWNNIDRSQELPQPPIAEASDARKKAADEAMGDDELAAIYEELERRRRKIAEDAPANGDDFRVGVKGGAWTMANRGVSADAASARAANALAIEFCHRRSVPKTVRFELSLYGEANAAILARFWAHRMQYFFDLEVLN